MGDSTLHSKHNLLEKLYQTQSGSLSSYVANLLEPFLVNDDDNATQSKYEATRVEDATCLYAADREALEKQLVSPLEGSDGMLYYQQKTRLLLPMFRRTVRAVKLVSAETFVNRQSEALAWLCISKDEIIRCVEDGISNDPEMLCCSLLCLCCALERSLRNLLHNCIQSCPHLLKDIVSHSEIKNLLGATIAALLDLTVGPPLSLNIRNLVWHGFRPTNGHYGHLGILILYVIIQIGDVVSGKGVAVNHPPYSELDMNVLVDSHAVLMSSVNTSLTTFPDSELSMVQLSADAAVSLASKDQYGKAVCLLLACFEHFMRIAFCLFNNQPERLTTAVSSEYFTTLDHILEEFRADGGKNGMYELLPDRLRTAIFDTLLYSDGLRLRDRLSHMELSYQEIPQCLWYFLYNVVTTTMMVLVFGETQTDVERYLCDYYEPVYHPLALLIHNASIVQANLTAVNLPVCADMVHGHDLDGVCSVDINVEDLAQHFDVSDVDSVYMRINLFNNNEGYRNLTLPSHLITVSELLKIVDGMCRALYETADCLHKFASDRYSMFVTQTLRSRQRKNYQCFLRHYGTIIQVVTVLTAIAVKFINQMEQSNCKVTRTHKLLLQLCENLHSFVFANKWCQCVGYLGKFIHERFC